MQSETTNIALCFKALADDTRVHIFNMLKSGEMCACKILEHLQCTQPTLSYHMKIMTECGLVVGIKKGKWMHYHLSGLVKREMLKFLTNDIEVYYDE